MHRFLIPSALLIALTLAFAAQAEKLSKTTTSEVSTPYGGAPHAIPGLIEAEHYDEGPAGVAYHDVEEKNLGAPYRRNTQVDIERRKDASNGHGIGWTRAGEWLHYTVEVKEAGTYRIALPVASNKKGGTFHLEMNGEDVTGPIHIPDTGGWDKLKTITVDNVQLRAGAFVMRAVMDTVGPSGSIGDIDYLHFTAQPAGNRETP